MQVPSSPASAVSIYALGFILLGSAAAQDLPNQAEPFDNVTTAGQPDAASLSALAAAGVTTVIDLRGSEEDRGFDEAVVVEELGMRYISLPVNGPDGVTFENAATLDRLLDGAQGRVLIHCSTSNRAGALLALRDKLLGAGNEAALELGRAAGLKSLEPVVRDRLESAPPQAP